ncbi:MAG: hypothetical protein CM15mP77_0080 [Synechococcus sp.]|nr:MAG: hypothetical protein CM15mP77_0080 [Synechococcus sp.]
MHVQVHHQKPLHFAVIQQDLCRGGNIIEDAEARSNRDGTMGSPARVTGDAVLYSARRAVSSVLRRITRCAAPVALWQVARFWRCSGRLG